MKLKGLAFLGLTVVLLLALLEVIFRLYGSLEIPLYREDPHYEYILKTNQNVRPRGVLIKTNNLGLRSEDLGKKKGKRILIIGDSVINGAYSIDHSDLATTLLRQHFEEQFGPCEVIALAMNSWGPENAMAFIEAHGDLEADIAILVCSSHDAYDNMTFEPIIDQSPSYPSERPDLALQVVLRKLWQRIFPPKRNPEYLEMKQVFNSGFRDLAQHCKTNEIPFAWYLHYELPELKKGAVDRRGQEIIDLAQELDIPLFHGAGSITSKEQYEDIIHLNAEGHRQLSFALLNISKELIDQR